MKFLRFDGDRTGLLVGHSDAWVLDLGAALSQDRSLGGASGTLLAESLGPDGRGSWETLIDSWEMVGPDLTALVRAAENDRGSLPGRALANLRIDPPLVSKVHRIFVGGANFTDHSAAAVGAGKPAFDPVRNRAEGLPPAVNTVLNGTVVASGSVQRPIGVLKLDYEAELAAVIRSKGYDVNGATLDIWGYSAFNDLSVRDVHFGLGFDHDRGPFPLPLQKNFEGANTFGPWIIVDELEPGADIRFGASVNGEVRQDLHSTDMGYSFGDFAQYLSRWVQLRPGDTITSGTGGGCAVEGGVDGPYLADGDVVEVYVEDKAVLRNQIVASRSGSAAV
jgi:2-keto-4-pentenoate hydratase/2-oxohepta-3-ene-1,7-dioic acid hydratase in catechol pathway